MKEGKERRGEWKRLHIREELREDTAAIVLMDIRLSLGPDSVVGGPHK